MKYNFLLLLHGAQTNNIVQISEFSLSLQLELFFYPEGGGGGGGGGDFCFLVEGHYEALYQTRRMQSSTEATNNKF